MQKSLSMNKISAVVALCVALVGCTPSSEGLKSSAENLIAKGDFKGATLQLKTLLANNPSSSELRFLLGTALSRNGDLTAGVLELKKARELGHPDDLVVPEIARALIAVGGYRALVKEYGDIKLLDPKAFAEFKTLLATAHGNLGDFKLLKALTEEAFVLAPEIPSVKLAQAKLLAGSAKVDDALKLIDEVMASGALAAEAQLLRGDILLRARRDVEAALSAYRSAAASNPAMVNAHISIIGVEISRNKPAAAKQQLEVFRLAVPKNPQVSYTDAQLAFIGKDYGRARDILHQMLRIYPDVASLRTFAGATQLKLGLLLQAEASLSKAVQLAPQMALAREYLARTYLLLAQPDKALTALAPLLDSVSVSADALSVAGEAYLQAGNFANAEVFFGRALKLKPNDPALRTSAALSLLVKGRPDDAFRDLQAIADSDAGTVSDLAIVSARMRRGEYELALKAIDQLQRKLPTDPQAFELRGRVFLVRKDETAARAAFEQALKIQPAYFSASRQLALLDINDQQPDRARQRMEDALKANPRNADARLILVDLRRRAGAKPDEMNELLKSAVAASPGHVGTRLAWINHYAGIKDGKRQLAAAQDAIAAIPDNIELLGALGDAQFAANDVQQSIRTFSRIIALQPRSELAHLRVVDVTIASGDAAASILALRRGLEALPDSVQLRRRLVALSRKPQTADGAMVLTRSLQQGKTSGSVGFLAEGDVLFGQKQWSAAAAAYRKAVGRPPVDPQAAPKLHGALIAADDLAAADAFAKDWLKTHPKDVAFRLHLGSRALTSKNYAQAEKYLSEAIAIDGRNVKALNNLAWLMAEQRRKGALVLAERAAALDPQNAVVLDTLAKAQQLESTGAQAIATLRRAVSLAPDNLGLHLSLIRMLSAEGMKDEALQMVDSLAQRGRWGDAALTQEAVAILRREVRGG